MTIAQALDHLDAARPNQYPKADKLRWLSELDGQIFQEVLLTHEDPPEGDFPGYDDVTPEDTMLLAKEPYSKIYLPYLCAQVDFYSAEYGRYNNHLKRFEAEYQAFTDWYNRAHRPLAAGQLAFGIPAAEASFF